MYSQEREGHKRSFSALRATAGRMDDEGHSRELEDSHGVG